LLFRSLPSPLPFAKDVETPFSEALLTAAGCREAIQNSIAILMFCAYPFGCFQPPNINHRGLPSVWKGGLIRTIHVYRATRDYFVDGIYWGAEAEGVRFYLRVTGVPPEEITKALEQVAQEGTSMIQHE
jgi:hypothetical protein